MSVPIRQESTISCWYSPCYLILTSYKFYPRPLHTICQISRAGLMIWALNSSYRVLIESAFGCNIVSSTCCPIHNFDDRLDQYTKASVSTLVVVQIRWTKVCFDAPDMALYTPNRLAACKSIVAPQFGFPRFLDYTQLQHAVMLQFVMVILKRHDSAA